MSIPRISVCWAASSLQSTCLQDFGSQYIKAVATSGTLGQFDYSIETLSISCGVSMSEVVENGISIVLDGQREGQECINYVRCNLCKPGEVPLQETSPRPW